MKNKPNNLFLHADGDAFFVACELTREPQLKGKPVIVGEDRGIAVAMSSEAKNLGVTRGMPIFQIKKQYPTVVILSHHFDLYHEISRKMHEILLSYFETVEVYSIDECFAIVKPSDIVYFKGEKKLLTDIKNEIQESLGVTYSFGLARTKALAKQASKLEKPNGMVLLLTHDDEVRALKATALDDIWGIGKRIAPRLHALGLHTAYDFVRYSSEKLRSNFSEPLTVLQKELGGESIMEVVDDVDPRDQKSLQSTSTFRPPSTDIKIIWGELVGNAEHACQRARAVHLVSNKVSFFVKTNDFVYYSDEAKLTLYSSDPGAFLRAIKPKLAKLLKRGEKIRSTGITLHNLIREENTPKDLFGEQAKVLKKLIVEETADKMRKKYGNDIIKRASSLKKK